MPDLKITIILALCLAGSRAYAQDSGADRPGLSRQMRSAIHLYEAGDDLESMNSFMDILTHGDPSERPMANQYLNLITKRMSSSGGAGGSPAAATQAAPAEPPPAPTQPPVAVESAEPPSAPPPAVKSATEETAPAKPAASTEPMSAANKALMRQEIQARLRAAQEKSVADLRALDGVRVIMRSSGKPAAIGIPTPLLFRSGISFQRDAGRILDPLTRLVFALGETQVVILPEGTAIGDAKVLDMRRTMGISAHLYEAGVAPARVRVNLLNTQVDLPRGLLDFKGVVISFVYDQPMNLEADAEVGDELGPPISLGVFPPQLRPSRNQGAIIEFSVTDPPSGLTSWKFQLLQPAAGGEELAPLQEVLGGGPVFHQIFWNARQNYFGAPLAPGRYECVLTATDTKNRQRALHRWITVLAENQAEENLLATPIDKAPAAAPARAADASASAAPADALPSARASAPLVKGVKAEAEIAPKPAHMKKPKRRVAKRAVRRKKAKPKPQPDSADGAPAKPGRYKLKFDSATHELTAAAERALAKAAKAYSPGGTLKVIGHAGPDEADAAALADRRAKLVVGLLINRYQIDPKSIQMSTSDAADAALVEVVVGGKD